MASISDLRTAVTFLEELLQKSGSVDEHRLLQGRSTQSCRSGFRKDDFRQRHKAIDVRFAGIAD